MAHFILVHGMFHGGWCWDRLKRRLEADGHTVQAPDLAGCGVDPTPPGQATLAGWGEAIAALARVAPQPVVLVGHSRGGVVISEAGERAPEHVAALVYLTALLIPDGMTAVDLPRIMQEEGFEAPQNLVTPTLNAEGTAMLLAPAAIEGFYSRCTLEDRAWAVPQVGPEPLMPVMTPVSVTPERWGALPRVYIETTEDAVLPTAGQRAMVARSGVEQVYSLAADHMPILTHVDELAAMLGEVAARHGPRPAVAA
jgi:pimeloyl-ACP methyl ester carboxylesterase